MICKVARVHIVNINGAPGFGKSTLAIHVGYEITKNGTYVRYINMEDRVFTVMIQPRRSESETAVPSDTNIPPQMQKLSTSLTEGPKYSLFVSVGQKSSSNESEDVFEELQGWSEKLNCMSVLIIDNCDDILASTTRHRFLKLIDTLVIIKSHLNLHIVVVSREKLFYVESFDC